MKKIWKSIVVVCLCLAAIGFVLPGTSQGAFVSNVNEWFEISGTWEEGEDGLTGTGGGNCFYSSDVYVSGKQDFTFELDAAGSDAFGFGIAIFSDEYAPEADWYCFQADTRSNNITFFHIEEGSMVWQQSRDFTEPEKTAESYHLKVTYTAADKRIAAYYGEELIHENVGTEVSGYLGLKLYECTAVFNNITYTGSEAPTPRPSPTATEPSAVTPTPTAAVNGGTATPEQTAGITPTAAPGENDGNNGLLLILVAAAIVVAAVVVTVIIVKKKKS